MSESEREPFCANTSCKFHKYSVCVGVKYIEYIEPVQFGEIKAMQNSEDQSVNGFYHASIIKRDRIYKNGMPMGKFCTKCARILLGLPTEADGDE